MSSEESSRLLPQLERSDTSTEAPTSGQLDLQRQRQCDERECGVLIACVVIIIVFTGLIIYNHILTTESSIHLTCQQPHLSPKFSAEKERLLNNIN